MKTASVAMLALLTSAGRAQKLVQCDLYTLYLVSGATYYYTSGDRTLPLSGNSYLATGPTFRRGQTRSTVGVQVDNLEVELSAKETDLLGTTPWLHALADGALDGARMLVERFISDSWENLAPGKIYQFSGRVRIDSMDRLTAKLSVVSDLILLNQKLPRNVYQSTCLHTLYDAGCTKLKADFTVSGIGTDSGSTASLIVAGSLGPYGVGYFDLGVITFTSGSLAGQRRTVRAHSYNLITPVVPFSGAPSGGSTFSIYPGCNKLREGDCLTKFNNQINFKATPYVPIAEMAQ